MPSHHYPIKDCLFWSFLGILVTYHMKLTCLMYRTPIISSYFVRNIPMTKPALLKDHAADTAESVDADLGCLGETQSLRQGGKTAKAYGVAYFHTRSC